MYFHRVVIDFSHDVERASFTEYFDEIVGSVMDALEPGFHGSEEYGQEVWISAKDVTDEYDDLYNNGVTELREELSDDTALDRFMQGIHFKDYPRPVDPEANSPDA